MGKRSNFKRRDKDTYDTFDPKALPPLLRHLPKGVRFWEPCGGQYDLAAGLEAAGHECVVASDIAPRDERVFRCDAMTVTAADVMATGAEAIITNPVWSRPLMHAMIDHFSRILPTWLLFDASWAHTEQKMIAKKHGVRTAPDLLQHCHMIVSVGRLIWIEGTTTPGKDDVCWYLFDQRQARVTSNPVFVPQLSEAA
ncbi:hypothetical protein RSK20926_11704 [Roseobacter sp. SK209-2-6]|uniref:hypothetical protein n=1 Tax=Roseobacter sp. SK209-2-6 TaxID=388739 RepID=UPI0000F3C4A1|nr:hypothetical protein [Roseobacter sp. SK209-2-6]EBA18382.1 hypothetical protein RSK20926_11704 [Roseobacter sp. SK209-2-6]